jgi:hypothetical protein
VAALSYAAVAGFTWLRYGRGGRRADGHDADRWLDQFIPEFDIREHHEVRVAAPVDTAFAAACALDLQRSAIIRGLFATRAWVMGATADRRPAGETFLEQVRSIGWGVLGETPGREIVMGAVTRPWKADVVFQTVPPDGFRSFAEPGYVKIVWTLRADALGVSASRVSTETRVATTDAAARERFRRYWAAASPGIVLIRYIALALVKRSAERQAAAGVRSQRPSGAEPL